MAAVECRDIFNAVYTYVRSSYISNLFSSKVKSTTSNESIDESEDLTMTKTSEPASETNVKSREVVGTNTEIVKESVERMDENTVADKIRIDLEEKFPFALASVCSNLATIDREYRKFKNEGEQPKFSEYLIEVTDDFPLADRFVFPAIMYISSMVLIDIDEKRSDDYYDKYASSVTQIVSEIPFENGKMAEKYPY